MILVIKFTYIVMNLNTYVVVIASKPKISFLMVIFSNYLDNLTKRLIRYRNMTWNNWI